METNPSPQGTTGVLSWQVASLGQVCKGSRRTRKGRQEMGGVMTVIKTLSLEELQCPGDPRQVSGQPVGSLERPGSRTVPPAARCHLGQSTQRPVARVRLCRVRKKSKGDLIRGVA